MDTPTPATPATVLPFTPALAPAPSPFTHPAVERFLAMADHNDVKYIGANLFIAAEIAATICTGLKADFNSYLTCAIQSKYLSKFGQGRMVTDLKAPSPASADHPAYLINWIVGGERHGQQFVPLSAFLPNGGYGLESRLPACPNLPTQQQYFANLGAANRDQALADAQFAEELAGQHLIGACENIEWWRRAIFKTEVHHLPKNRCVVILPSGPIPARAWVHVQNMVQRLWPSAVLAVPSAPVILA